MRTISIPNELLIDCQKAYNSSIVEHRGSTFMFYRYEERGSDYNTKLAVCELDSNFMPIKHTNRELKLPRWSAKVTTFDDPRAFILNGLPTIIYPHGHVVPTKDGWLWACSLAIVQFARDMRSIEGSWLPRYGNNVNCSSDPGSNLIASEKNWSPFIEGNRLLMLYSINPLVVLEHDYRQNKTSEIQHSPAIDLSKWKWGTFLGGGTPLIHRVNEYVGFFHSFTNDHPNKPNVRTYHVGFFAISDKHPYRMTRISKFPLMTAEPDSEQDLRGPTAGWRPNCVYPCGYIERNGKIYLSYGWQDCRCKIEEIEWDEIESNIVNVDQMAAPYVPPAPQQPSTAIKPGFSCTLCGKVFSNKDRKKVLTHTC